MTDPVHGPFRFYTRLTLTTLTGRKARDAKELLDGLRSVSDDVIYRHTHRFIREHQFLTPEPANDFAYWATSLLGDEELGERLSYVDILRHGSLADLRTALATAVNEHLDRRGPGRPADEGKEFFFLGAVRFSIPTTYVAGDLAQFAEALRKVSLSSLFLHVYEARLRPGQRVNDFSRWFQDALGRHALAEKITRLDPYSRTLEDLRAQILQFIDEEVSLGAP